ncbi:MAG TPA: arylsulfatase [Thermomicrobiales bacterium]|nr:arylsulfatase [Thermomicrobiales bacterium]
MIPEDPSETDVTAAPTSPSSTDRTTTRRAVVGASMATAAATLLGTRSGAQAQTGSPVASPVAGNAAGKPNIVAIMADDIGYWNISAYNSGMMGYQTPNIDRVGAEGMRFTDAYGEQSCTAGRAAFITGQSPYRTGLIKIGVPGQDQGLSAKDPTIAELLKPLGYATGHYGKNHLGDLNKFLPTVHGFDEFFGNLYHLNAEEEPENPDYPQNPAFAEKYGPRGVIRSYASDVEDPTVDPRFGPVGFQTVEDTGPLDTTRMETIDDEITDGALDYIERQVEADNPFFLWYCPTRMHIFTHLKPESEGVTGLGIEADGMVEHDGHVGQILDKLDELGIADNTIVIYSTDNGAQVFSWPDGSMTPFRSEKNSTWEGGYRIPMMVRWPGQIPAGSLSNGIISLQDWLPTLLSAAGQPDIKEQLLDGYTIGDTTYNVHIDGFDQLPMLTEGVQTLRNEYYYFGDTGSMVGMRQGRWKLIMQEQLSEGFDVWFQPYTDLRSPMIVDLLGDPFEKAMQVSGSYEVWMLHHMFLLAPMVQTSQLFLSTFQDYPPRQQNPAE